MESFIHSKSQFISVVAASKRLRDDVEKRWQCSAGRSHFPGLEILWCLLAPITYCLFEIKILLSQFIMRNILISSNNIYHLVRYVY